MDDIAKRVTTPSPTIIAIRSPEDCKYCLVIEKEVVITEILSFSRALSLFLAIHYIFNLHYEKLVREVVLFLQEFLFGLPAPNAKKSSTYLSVTSNLQSFAVA